MIPRRGGRLARRCCGLLLEVAGWRFSGALPARAKAVIVVAPHTSNWDFVIGMLAAGALGIRLHWMGKHTLFRPPLGWLMRWLGGLPVDRRAPHGAVAQTVAEFARRDALLLAVTPEGTRRRADRWKTGFWHIAMGAGVPLFLVSLDYTSRRIRLGPELATGQGPDEDLAKIRAHFATVRARHPGRYGAP